jgi:cyclopropane-fatty-acyl-phospholipid synthase
MISSKTSYSMLTPTKLGIWLAERGGIPSPVLRRAIRAIVGRRLRAEQRHPRSLEAWVREMASSDIAIATDAANAQHYEVPPAFFERVLGPHMKYSSAYWPTGVGSLAEAERAMLALTMERAELGRGQRILELGCGWGSLTLAMARRFPSASIHAVSNSSRQREFILARASNEGLLNVTVETADMNAFAPSGRFDRVVSVEMFEHMRNWPELLRRVHGWLDPRGALFVHVFAHRTFAYPYDDRGDDDWMARQFFTGGMMPSDDLLPRVASAFDVPGHWRLDGTHYGRTAEAWHDQLVANRGEIIALFSRDLGATEARLVYHRWKLFLLACAELFNYRGGTEWIVSHYLLRPKAGTAGVAA